MVAKTAIKITPNLHHEIINKLFLFKNHNLMIIIYPINHRGKADTFIVFKINHQKFFGNVNGYLRGLAILIQ